LEWRQAGWKILTLPQIVFFKIRQDLNLSVEGLKLIVKIPTKKPSANRHAINRIISCVLAFGTGVELCGMFPAGSFR
jgi:hypothetical protein